MSSTPHVTWIPIANDFDVDARAVFETIVKRLTDKPDLKDKAKPLFYFFHNHESQYGELSQIHNLEKRMADLYPEDPQLKRFSYRFRHENPSSHEDFNPTTVRHIISMGTQAKPKLFPNAIPSIEDRALTPNPPDSYRTTPQPSMPQSPRQAQRQRFVSPRPFQPSGTVPSPPGYTAQAYGIPTTTSPTKRPFADLGQQADESRKLARGESPLKGAAGRRLDAHKRGGLGQGGATPVPPLPRDISFFLSILPRPELCMQLPRLDLQRVMHELARADLSNATRRDLQGMQGQGGYR